MNLERAIEIAVEAHKGVKDKGGNPYILHPLTVMHNLDTEVEKIVGALHDVVEDTHWTFEKLAEEGFSDEIVDAIRSVTKSAEDHDYSDFINRAKNNTIGRKVKIADIKHNMDVTRIKQIGDTERERLNKYLESLKVLQA